MSGEIRMGRFDDGFADTIENTVSTSTSSSLRVFGSDSPAEMLLTNNRLIESRKKDGAAQSILDQQFGTVQLTGFPQPPGQGQGQGQGGNDQTEQNRAVPQQPPGFGRNLDQPPPPQGTGGVESRVAQPALPAAEAARQQQISTLIKQLNSDRYAIRQQAHVALRDIGAPAVGQLLEAITAPGDHLEVTQRARDIIGHMGAGAGDALLTAATSNNPQIRTEAETLLRNSAYGPALYSALDNPFVTPPERYAAAQRARDSIMASGNVELRDGQGTIRARSITVQDQESSTRVHMAFNQNGNLTNVATADGFQLASITYLNNGNIDTITTRGATFTRNADNTYRHPIDTSTPYSVSVSPLTGDVTTSYRDPIDGTLMTTIMHPTGRYTTQGN